MSNQIDGFAFLKDVDDHTLREWTAFMDSPLYAFLVKHFESKIKTYGEAALVKNDYILEPAKLAYLQGKAFGIRLVLERFFHDVRTEYKRRIDRSANAGAS
jgi:hypothetical protein